MRPMAQNPHRGCILLSRPIPSRALVFALILRTTMLERLARLGYASKAVIYGIVGVFAILAIANRGGLITDTSGALRLVLAQPFGRLLLLVLAIGLCGYAAWRLLDAVADPDRNGTRFAGLVTRIGNAVRGVIYGALGIEAFRMLGGLRGSRRDDAEFWTARILAIPLGEVVLGVAGGIAAVYGASEIVQGIRGTHDTKVDWSPVPSRVRPAVQRISRFGVAIRGGLIVTLGLYLVRAALSQDPDQAAGARESMMRLGGVFEGRWFLAVIAAGVIAYAVDQAVHARCRRIREVGVALKS